MSENLAKRFELPMESCSVKVGTAKKQGQMTAIGMIKNLRFAVNNSKTSY